MMSHDLTTHSDDKIFTPGELQKLGFPHRVTLAKWRAKRLGPPFIQLSPHRIGYRLGDVRTWAAARTVQTG
ncbi:helix-turn-helix transcriptional regulator [Lichenicola sp.]|uniref:helix-turn-helix transcriptional regulator n=1 Tax=Lichenicola sp. TaxID=2804529 RepID=UPI003B00E339